MRGATLRATIAYDGRGFHGFSVNVGVKTVAGEIERSLATILREPITITCAGRTDKGVHARAQVISFELPPGSHIELERLRYSLDRLSGPEIGIREVVRVADGFDARFSAKWRRYKYSVWNVAWSDPFRLGTTWHVRYPLDIDAMNVAATHLLGEHDFSSFCRRRKGAPASAQVVMERNVFDARWIAGVDDDVNVATFDIRASAFCHQMVRSIVGTLVDVGRGRVEPDSVADVLAAKDRNEVGRIAPPHGLTLWEVGY